MYNAPRSSSRNMPRHGSYGRRRRKKPVALLVLVCLLAVALVSAGAIWLVSGSQTKKAVSAFVDYLAQDNYTLARDLYEDASAKRRAKLDVPLTDKLLALADQAKAGDVADGAPIMGLAKFGDLMKPALSAATEAVEQRYIRDESLTWEQYSRVLDTFGRLNCPVDRLKNATATGEYYRQSRACFAQGMQAEQSDDYLTACEMFRQVVPEDTKYYSDAQQRLAIAREKLAVNAFTTADTLVGQYQYSQAKQLLERAAAVMQDDASFMGKYTQYVQQIDQKQTELVPYEGTVEHLFTHCLIAYPEIANNPQWRKDYYTNCVTVKEFNAILEELYKRNYILIDINMLIDDPDGDGQNVTLKKPLMLPKGKKPLVLSFDDMVYDARKTNRGMVDKLILDEKGEIATYTKFSDGREEVRYDNDIVPILDAFVKQHPDFSFDGAKGTIALTGFQGILGYRTQHDAPAGTDIEKEKAEARKVVDKLKENGWNFASHSYAHYYTNSGTAERTKSDADQWLSEVGSLVGPTRVLVWPYGDRIKKTDARYQILVDAGFRIFCGVGSMPYLAPEQQGTTVLQDRRPLDGTMFGLPVYKERYAPLFDVDAVRDPARPAYPYD